jgi:hypothetical protein
MTVKRGILLIASGSPFYGRMAFNLCMSIKATDPNFPVAVAISGSSLNHLNSRQKALFDEILFLPSETSGFGAKLFLDQISPFEETLFFDADMAWLPKYSPHVLFDSLKDVDFTAITEGYCDIKTQDKANANSKYYFWADTEEIAEVYNIREGNLYQWRSEVMYFRKSERTAAFFKTAREIYATPNLNTIHLFANSIPDELAINISAAIHDIEPHKYKWMPAYWPRMNGGHVPSLEELYSKYYLLSCGSNVTTANTKLAYNRVVKAAAYKLGFSHLFPLANKKETMPDRQTM